MHKFCVDIGHRHVGSSNNKVAIDYFEKMIKDSGFTTERQEFDCIDWESGKTSLNIDSVLYKVFPSPYSLSCDLRAELISAKSLDVLNSLDVEGKVLLLHGQIAREQVMAKNFVFYNPDEHKAIISTLESKKPAAIIAATGKNPELAGGWYPFPMFEDGDFDIPSVYMKDIDGVKLLDHVGEIVELQIESQRIPSTGCNIVATKKGEVEERIVICAHIDTKKSTPGALDNGTGLSILLLLADILKNYNGKYTLEIVALNGEDYYSAPGQMKYLEENESRFSNIKLVVNIDAAGSRNVTTAFSFYEVPAAFQKVFENNIKSRRACMIGDPWYQGDHSIFIQRGCPAIAVTSENFMELCTEVTHTEKDTVDLVDDEKLVEIAYILGECIEAISS